jgi:phage terminase large subunit-like protein
MTKKVTFSQGSKEWKQWREWCTVPDPGKRSALYFLMSQVCGLQDLIPMTESAHLGMCLFAEGATGIPEIDNARVRMIQVARGFGKSGVVTAGLPLQLLLRHDGYSVGIANETEGMAQKFLAQIKLQFEQNDTIKFLFPERIPDFKRTTWSASEIVIKRTRPRAVGPSVLATGVGGTKTGTHVDMWLLDDLISQDLAENALRGNTTEIEKMERWITRLPPMLNSPMRDPIVVIGTPWYEGDTYDFIERYFGDVEPGISLSKAPKDFKCVWRLKLASGQVQHLYLYRRGDLAVFRRPALDEDGNSIFPERWTTEELQAMRSKPETAAFFSANYLLDPSAGLASEFNVSDLKYWKHETETTIEFWNRDGELEYVPIRDMATFISVDPAFSDKASSARTAIPVLGLYEGHIFLLEDFAEHGMGTYDIANTVTNFALKYKPRKIFIETIAAQAALIEPIRRTASEHGLGYLNIEEIPSHGRARKEARIYGLDEYFRRRRFYIHRSHDRFLQEYSTFPRTALKDVLDAISFQRTEWEKLLSREDQGESSTQVAHQQAIAKIRQAVGAHGGY